MPPLFKWLLPCRHKKKAVEPQLLGRHLADDQMSVVNRVERSAEEADSPGLTHQRAW